MESLLLTHQHYGVFRRTVIKTMEKRTRKCVCMHSASRGGTSRVVVFFQFLSHQSQTFSERSFEITRGGGTGLWTDRSKTVWVENSIPCGKCSAGCAFLTVTRTSWSHIVMLFSILIRFSHKKMYRLVITLQLCVHILAAWMVWGVLALSF